MVPGPTYTAGVPTDSVIIIGQGVILRGCQRKPQWFLIVSGMIPYQLTQNQSLPTDDVGILAVFVWLTA